jgi:hypothetical protein
LPSCMNTSSRSHHAYLSAAVDVGGRNAATSQATFAELVPSPRGVFSRLRGMSEWQSEIDDEKSLRIQVVQMGGSRTLAYAWEAADPTSHSKILVKRPIFREHGSRSTFFLGGGRTEEVLITCADFDPHGVWEALRPYFWCPDTGHSFTYSFPAGVVDRLAHDKILAWANEDPNVRPAMIARLLVLDVGNDDSLASRILESHGKREDVSAEFFAALLGSESRGPLSEHWYQLADTLLTSAARSELHGLKSWSQAAAKALKEMAERERQRENEFDLGRGR